MITEPKIVNIKTKTKIAKNTDRKLIKDFKIVRYTREYKALWDDFVQNSKNGTLLFQRDYMDYHSDRFQDFSLMFFVKGNLMAILPANLESDVLSSHSGLTYGGIVSGYQLKTANMLEIFDKLKDYLKEAGIKKLIYKVIPYVYHSIPAQEDLYALYVNNASIIKKDFSACISLQAKDCRTKNKISKNIAKAAKKGLTVRRSYDVRSFLINLEEILKQKYNTRPVHNLGEIELLASRFPETIKLFAAFKDGRMLAGIILYECNQNVIHIQYQTISEEGKKYFALDYIYNNIIQIYRPKVKYLSFGSSIIRETGFQNPSLLRYKETLGARIIQHDTYQMEVT